MPAFPDELVPFARLVQETLLPKPLPPVGKLIADNPFIPVQPTSKQLEFLSYDGLEALYGGAGGGGKSIALLTAAAMYVGHRNYNALILRRTFSELVKPGALIDVAKSWWLANNAVDWNAQEKKFTFPSGSTITFGYLEHEDDRYQYQSAAFQAIFFDELTEFPENSYRFLFSRLRKTEGNPIPLRMRSATNPGGRGHAWVKKRFLTSPDGRQFFPAKLEDNPHLDQAAYLSSLAELDPVTRRQIKDADWTDPEGGRFHAHWLRYYTLKGDGYAYFGDDRLFYLADLAGRFLTVDTAATAEQLARGNKARDPDWTVISAWGLHPRGFLVWLGCRRLRLDIPSIPAEVAQMYLLHKATRAYIEDVGTGKGPVAYCKLYPLGNGFMNIISVGTKSKDKLSRSTPAQNMAEAGRIWLPANDPAFPLEEVRSEVLGFTGDEKQDAHDDVVDTLSMAAAIADERGLGNAAFTGDVIADVFV